MSTPPPAPPIPEVVPSIEPPDDTTLRALAEAMVLTRTLDVAAVRWQRQGLLPAFPPALGQEAAQVGSAIALEPRDFSFITYRDHGVVAGLGASLEDYMSSHLGRWNGGLGDPNVTRHSPLQAVVGTTGLHAVGWALAQRMESSGAVAVAYHGDGASSQGDVHEAMNFAAVMRAPVVFFVQNNQWSLSTPIHKQVAGLQVAPRAAGYGMPALQVDGDDVVAVWQAVRAVVDDEAWWAAAQTRADAKVEAVHEHLSTLPPMPGDDLFDFVFVEKTPQIAAQQAQWREETDRD